MQLDMHVMLSNFKVTITHTQKKKAQNLDMISKYRVGLSSGHLQNRWVGIHLVTQQHPQVIAVSCRKHVYFSV